MLFLILNCARPYPVRELSSLPCSAGLAHKERLLEMDWECTHSAHAGKYTKFWQGDF